VSKFTYLAAPYIVRTDRKIGSVRLVFDIETNGLADQATKAHCSVIADLDSDQINTYGPEQIAAALKHLARADYLTGHNICGFDLPLLHRLYDWAPAPECTIVDTLVASRLILPHIDDLDDKATAMGDPALGKLLGRHSLEAWGARLGIPKIGADITDWSVWTPEMQERCAGDVAICKVLWRFLAPDGYSKQAMELEHRTAVICNRITADGVPFDTKAAERLRRQWTTRRSVLEAQLSQEFPGTNLNSRVQIAALLEARGWVPGKYTEKTKQPKIDDELLETIPVIYPEFTGLAEHYTLGRRLGQLADGDKAWLKHIGEDERIHGTIVHIGTPHSRAAHFNPNLAQVPNPKRGKPLAAECRALFHHAGDWLFVACDQAGLQDRCFSHYLAAFDGGDYGQSFIAGKDTHWATATALGLISSERDKANKLHTALREGSKSFRYGFLFGMRAKRAGEIIANIVHSAQQIDPSYRGPSTDGAQALRRFEAATPGLKQLRSWKRRPRETDGY
jgi:DNA polymerase I